MRKFSPNFLKVNLDLKDFQNANLLNLSKAILLIYNPLMDTNQPVAKCFGKCSDTPDVVTCKEGRRTLLHAHGIDRTAETGICQGRCAFEICILALPIVQLPHEKNKGKIWS